MFAFSKDLTVTAVRNFMTQVWNFVTLPEIYYHEEGYFLARFKNIKDRDEVMKRGPNSIFSMPLFLRNWSPDFVMTY